MIGEGRARAFRYSALSDERRVPRGIGSTITSAGYQGAEWDYDQGRGYTGFMRPDGESPWRRGMDDLLTLSDFPELDLALDLLDADLDHEPWSPRRLAVRALDVFETEGPPPLEDGETDPLLERPQPRKRAQVCHQCDQVVKAHLLDIHLREYCNED